MPLMPYNSAGDQPIGDFVTTIENSSQEPEIWRRLRGVQEIVINICHGGFSLSHEAVLRYHQLQGQPIYWRNTEYADISLYYTDPAMTAISSWRDQDIRRDDPYLVRVVQDMGGEAAGGAMAVLKVVEIPAGVQWFIQEYDGKEWIAERHRIWS
jgi:hypothetical protein